MQLGLMEAGRFGAVGEGAGDEGGDIGALQQRAGLLITRGALQQHVECDHVHPEARAAGGNGGDHIVEGGRGAQHRDRGEGITGLRSIDGREQRGGVGGRGRVGRSCHVAHSNWAAEHRQGMYRTCGRNWSRGAIL